MKINSVDDVACSINSFEPEFSRSLVFIEHRTCHLSECSVLALHDAILLRCVWSRELMCDAQGIKISVKAGVLEFYAIVTPDVLDLDAIIGHGTIGESSKDILHFSLVKELCAPRYISNNHQQ